MTKIGGLGSEETGRSLSYISHMTYKNSILFRRELHDLAELSNQEKNTSAYIASKLIEMGFEVKENVGGYGLVVDIASDIPGPVTMIRADMDALPYPDETDPDKTIAIHACGHDAHCAVLLGAAEELRKTVKKGKVRMVFQPGEESLTGAQAMIKDNVLDGVDIVIGSHIRPIQDIPVGSFCASVNHVACATSIVTITGELAHAARPHLGINPIEAAAQLINAVGLIKVDPNKSWSVKPTQIQSEKGATNSIPNYVKVTFDIRAQDNDALEQILARVDGACVSLKHSFNADAKSEIIDYCPGPEYDQELVELIKNTIVEQFGEQSLAKDCGGGGEDFHFYKKAKPEVRSVYFGIGSGAEPGLHCRDMHFDDSVLPSASKLLVEFVRKLNG